MPSIEELNIDLRIAARENKAASIQLGDEFFSSLDQEEINGGNIQVILNITEPTTNRFKIRLAIEGSVSVMCDRCLEDVSLDVVAEDEYTIAAEETECEDEDIRVLPVGVGYKYDFSWDIYELTALSLPIQRVHEDESCNAEMANILKNIQVSEE
jgi:uncharacterized metal-binding protein YceD (DUF177 family)